MKPTKNKVFCVGCAHHKMLFESKAKAVRYLQYNADEVEAETGKRPVRAYFCPLCGGWHVTSKPFPMGENALKSRFGEERGSEMYMKIQSMLGTRTSIATMLSLKIKGLKHLLKFEYINVDKCKTQIQELLEIFEIVMESQLEEKNTLNTLLYKFQGLCTLFITKRQLLSA